MERREILEKLPDPRLLIGGERKESAAGHLRVEDPARGESVAEVAAAGSGEVDAAVIAARGALETGEWGTLDARDRGHLLRRLAELVKEEAETLAGLECLDVGKTLAEARLGDLAQVVDALGYFAGLADKIEGRTLPVRGGSLNYTLREAVGVVAAIIPWNFPLLMAAWKLGPALAAGCTVILKPAEQTPLTALALASLIEEAGFPPGVVNVLPGTGEVAGRALVAHPGVDKIAFTGSTEVGREIASRAAPTLKRVSLELGGKSPNLVFADAGDLAEVASKVAMAAFYNQGQCCTAGSRILVEKEVLPTFTARLVEVANALRVGDPFDRRSQLGALVSAPQLERVLAYVEQGRADGAQCIAGGSRAPVPDLEGGSFMRPTVFTDVLPDTPLAREEIFGPVTVVIPFESTDEAVTLANDTSYGLAAGVWTRDVARAHEVARRLRAGTVWVNGYDRFDAASPFGGLKASGYGRENGIAAVDLYTEEKSVWIGPG